MKPTILKPVQTEDGNFKWNELEVKTSGQGGGKGVYAKQDLKVATVVVIFGVPVSKWTHHDHGPSHGWVRKKVGVKKENQPKLDGHPSLYPYKGVGSFGLAIAMMLNEPTKGKPSCIFKFNSVVVQRRIKKGEELTVFYGDVYERNTYSVEGNSMRKWVNNKLWELKVNYHAMYAKFNGILKEMIEEEERTETEEEEEEEEKEKEVIDLTKDDVIDLTQDDDEFLVAGRRLLN